MNCEYDDCDQPVILRAYASYNADNGENTHPRHARYPMPMIRACSAHIGELMLEDVDKLASTRQWLVVAPVTDSIEKQIVEHFRHVDPPESSACANPDGPFPPGPTTTPPAVLPVTR